jgi:hypothetical protein
MVKRDLLTSSALFQISNETSFTLFGLLDHELWHTEEFIVHPHKIHGPLLPKFIFQYVLFFDIFPISPLFPDLAF